MIYLKICVFVDPADVTQSLVIEGTEVNSGTLHRGRVVIDMTIGKSTEFRFAYQGSPITVILKNPSAFKVDLYREDNVNAFVFKPEGLAEVKYLHK